jgi:hypothetical protein
VAQVAQEALQAVVEVHRSPSVLQSQFYGARQRVTSEFWAHVRGANIEEKRGRD